MQRIFVMVAAVGMLVGSAGVAFGGNADFTLIPTGQGIYELWVAVSGSDTDGLSAFNLDVNGTTAEVTATNFEFQGILADGSVNPNVAGIAGTRGDNFSPGGFQTQLSGIIGDAATTTLYNAAASQALSDNGAIFGVGIREISILNPIIPPAGSNDIFFAAPALLGVLTTPVQIPATAGGITVGPITVDGALYDTSGSGEGFLPDSIVSLTIVPEPASLALLGLGGLCFFRRR